MKKHLSTIPNQEQLERLKNYFSFDEERKTFKVPLHYTSTDEIFEDKLDLLSPKMNDNVLETICRILSEIPKGYNADIELIIDDYKGYSKEQILQAFHDLILFHHHTFRREIRRKTTKVAWLVLSGIFIVLFMAIATIYGWWSKDGGLWDEVVLYGLDVLGYVLIWEGLYAALVEHDVDKSYNYITSKKLASISICEKEAKNVLVKENTGDFMVGINNPKIEKITAFLLIVAAFGFFGAAIFTFANHFLDIIEAYNVGDTTKFVSEIGIATVTLLIEGAIGAFSLRLYYGDKRFQIPCYILSLLMLALIIYHIVRMALSANWMDRLSIQIMETFIFIIYIAGLAFFVLRTKKPTTKK